MAMSVNTPTHMHDLIYGKWLPEEKRIEYYQWRIERIRTRKAQNILECRNCDLAENCAGGCIGETLNETRAFYGLKKETCEATKFLANHMDINKMEIPFLHP
jgi:radical SAM protein with 4Fe4S-binding SPASM domain